MNDVRKKVAICVATFRRPSGLQDLLKSLNCLRHSEEMTFCVLVVDNDPLGSARPTVAEISKELAYPVEYIVTPDRGISYARNAALDHCLEADAIAFIDDDEVADPAWLDELIANQKLYSADIVTGPVLSHFSCPPPEWAIRGKFYDRPRPASGTWLHEARTGNVLISSDLLRKTGIRFDHQFALSGSEDSDFFRRLNAAGAKIVAADTAIVYETVPASRLTARWLAMRALRTANCDGRQTLKRFPSFQTRFVLFASGSARFAKGATVTLFALLAGKHKLIRTIQRIGGGLGLIMASLGLVYNEYKQATPHGT